ncbi:Transcription factor bHLH111 [Mucuna pruriens]|uniref:Transcription factor bHLH111 n=1 Tax=Mucuna pruriens TaxID=157652 RepID=A0A371EHR6_MUCPR|nr:Transcription factor bHLH111 [Mucuna pruriens]
MTEESAGNTVATSITPLNWWYLQANSLSSWNDTNNAWNNQPNPNSSSSCEEDISVSTSFTNASNRSSLTVESSRRLIEPPAPSSNELMGEHASDNQLWSHVLSGVGSNGELHNSQEIGENFLDALSSKSMTSTMFQPVCDYLKKLDTSWEYSGPTSLSSFEKHLNGFSEAMIENNERLTKLSNLVSTWSIAPPDPEVSSHFDPQTNNMCLSSSMEHLPQSDHFKQPFGDSTPCSLGGASRNSGVFPCYDHDMKVKQEYHASESLNSNGYQNGFNNLPVGDSCKLYQGMPNFSSCTRNISDVISFNSRLGRPVVGIHAQKPSMKYLNVSEPKKQGLQTPSPIRTNVNGKGEGTTREVKKKRSEESSDAMLKKPKQEASTASSSKAPKVKLGDKITALQQIVSPFGKTDTASVLFEAIGYIKFLQEQVQVGIIMEKPLFIALCNYIIHNYCFTFIHILQLLSNPYLKTNSHKSLKFSLYISNNDPN